MTKNINSAQVLYKRKSPPTYETLKTRWFKNWQAIVNDAEKLRDCMSSEVAWLAWLEEHDVLEVYREAKAVLERKRKEAV